jgi:uncharacterized protein DUF1097
MDLITALAVVIGIMGGVATWGAVALGNAFVLIWAIFVGWGSFFHCGGKEDGLQKSIAGNIWGAICAAVALIALTSIGVTPVVAGICVGVTVLIMILGAKAPILSAIPAAVYGYASTAALFLLGAAGYGEGAAGIVKVAVAIAVSMVVGNVLGYISEKVVGAVVKG